MNSAQAPTMSYLTGSMTSLVGKLNEPKNRSMFGTLHEDLITLNKYFNKLASNGRVVVNLQVKLWIKQVREVVFDIEDWIDGKTETMGDSIEREDKIKEFRTLILEAYSHCERYDLLVKASADVTGLALASSKVIAVDSPQLFGEKTYDLVGLVGPKEMLKEYLLEERKKLKVISILGTGGLGKTTLAKELHRELQAEFPCGAFVYVGRNPSVRTILVNILYQIMSLRERKGYFKAPQKPDNDDFLLPREREHEVILEKHLNEQQVIALVWGHLSEKRYLIVLDGIWSIRHWRAIRGALPDNNLGSRILTTTRIKDVAESCSPRHTDVVHHMKALSEDESKSLFSGKEARPGDDEILKMCGGVPMAIILAARARKCAELAGPKMPWKSILSPLYQNSTAELVVTKILHMIYADLSLPVRSCFLYLSVFPEGYTIKKTRLIQIWGAEGFIPEEQLRETGESYFNELISRRLIQPVFKDNDYEAVGCIVHAVILDFIRSLSREENFATMASELSSGSFSRNTIRRFSVDCSDEDEAGVVASSRVHLASMRSLAVFLPSYYNPTETLPSTSENLPPPSVPAFKLMRVLDLLPDFKLMRVLDLEDTRNLENRHLSGIGGLVLLRYLGVRGTGIDQLPEEIGQLEQLETLDLALNRLPESIVTLENLMHLHLDMHFAGEKMVEEELHKVKNLLKYRNGLRTLGLTLTSIILQHHQYNLDGSGSRYAQRLTETIESVTSFFKVVFSRPNLQYIYIHSPLLMDSCSAIDDSGTEPSGCMEKNKLLMDSWKKLNAPPAARFEPRRFELIISDIIGGVSLKKASLVYLTHLRIKLLYVDAKVLGILGSLENLLSLNLSSANCPPKLSIIKKDLFKRLKAAFFKGQMGLVFQKKAMPNLQMLSFHRSKEHLYDGIQWLDCLTRVHAVMNYYGATDSEMKAWEAHIRKEVKLNPNKPSLEFIRS